MSKQSDNNLVRLHAAAAVVLGGQAVAFSYLMADAPGRGWRELTMSRFDEMVYVSNIRVAWLVLFALTWSTAWLSIAAVMGHKKPANIIAIVSSCRWLDYVVSSTAMIAITAMLSGINDVWAITLLSVSNICMIACGASLETYARSSSDKNPNIMSKTLLMVSWALFVAQWVSILGSFITALEDSIDAVPDAVKVIPPGLFLLFATFGVIHLLSLHGKHTPAAIERWYVENSFLSKTFLSSLFIMGSLRSDD
jgi:hypothetical protein